MFFFFSCFVFLFLSPTRPRAEVLTLEVATDSPGQVSVRKMSSLTRWSGVRSDHIGLFVSLTYTGDCVAKGGDGWTVV